MNLSSVIHKIIKEPAYTIRLIIAISRGVFYKIYFNLFRKNVWIGFPFKAFAKVRIIGDGTVSIGNNCSVDYSVFKGLSIVTLSSEAKVVIGDNCALQGLTIRCQNEVVIGDETMTALSLVQDTPFVDLTPDSRNKFKMDLAKPIKIGRNVWLGGESCVLQGSDIGDDSVLSAGTMCHAYQAKDYSLIIGNPSKRPLPIASLFKI